MLTKDNHIKAVYSSDIDAFLARLDALERNRQISRRMDTHGIIVVERFATFHYY